MFQDFLEFGFLRRAIVAGILVALSCACLSPFVVLRRMAFAGHGLAHAAFGGAAVALLLGVNVIGGAAFFALGLAVLLALWTRRGAISEDSAIGILVGGAMALGIVCLSLRREFTQDLGSFLFGNLLAVLPGDLWVNLAVTLATLACVALFRRPLVAATFHEEIARVEGTRVDLVRALLFVLVGANVVSAMKLVGAVLVSALLVVPGSLALLLAGSFGGAIAVSLAAAVAAVLLGMGISYSADLPPGGVMTLVLVGAFALVRSAGFLTARGARARS
jgi:ABC-type Mn2+/Zn2+ transport system permease subunit